MGTLGQTTRWDIDDPESYAHPRVPRDVLSGQLRNKGYVYISCDIIAYLLCYANLKFNPGNRDILLV